jgi:phosphate:Na+ symporter
MRAIVADEQGKLLPAPDLDKLDTAINSLRDRCLRLGAELPWAERGSILTLLGSAERAFNLVHRIIDERNSVPRDIAQRVEQPQDRPFGGAQPVPA